MVTVEVVTGSHGRGTVAVVAVADSVSRVFRSCPPNATRKRKERKGTKLVRK